MVEVAFKAALKDEQGIDQMLEAQNKDTGWKRGFLQSSSSQSVFLGPAAAGTSGNLEEMKIIQPHTRTTEQTLGAGPSRLGLNQLSR